MLWTSLVSKCVHYYSDLRKSRVEEIKCGENDALVNDDDNNCDDVDVDEDDGEYTDAVCDVRSVLCSLALLASWVD